MLLRIGHRRLASSLGLVLLVGAAGMGCADKSEALGQQLDRMQREISELRSTQLASQDRVAALEEELASTKQAQPTHSDRPALQVVRLVPDADPPESEVWPPNGSATAGAAGERPVLRADADGGQIDHTGETASASP